MKKIVTFLITAITYFLGFSESFGQCPFTVNAGPDTLVCATVSSVALNGSTNANPGTVSWSSSSGGTFTPSSNVLNPSYVLSATDKANGSVTLTLTESGICSPVSDNLVITIHAVPAVNAGNDTTVCSTGTAITIAGTKSNATGVSWSASGVGTFGSTTALSTYYNLTTADKTNGTVTLTLSTTGNGPCTVHSDQKVISITTAPTVTSSDKSICATTASTQVNGSVGGSATGGTWTTINGATGSFNNPTSMTPTYTPTTADKNTGYADLRLTTSNSTVCASTYHDMRLTILAVPTSNAGPDQSVCKNGVATLSGSTGGSAGGGTWSSNGQGTFGNNTSLNTTYTPAASDFNIAGGVVLTLITTGSGACTTPGQDQMTLTINNCTGLTSDHQKDMDLELYPNPGLGLINVEWKNANAQLLSADVMNAEGKLIRTIRLQGSQIDISDLGKGMYFLKLTDTEGSQLSKKIVIQ
ncbi:MAG: T9SS type A sorting domain-containing protein [Cytophagaceae bacterium]